MHAQEIPLFQIFQTLIFSIRVIKAWEGQEDLVLILRQAKHPINILA